MLPLWSTLLVTNYYPLWGFFLHVYLFNLHMFNFKALAATALIGATAFIAPGAEARMQHDMQVGGYKGVTIIERSSSRHSVDTLVIPFPEGNATINVVCATGDFEYTSSMMTSRGARQVVGAWCGY